MLRQEGGSAVLMVTADIPPLSVMISTNSKLQNTYANRLMRTQEKYKQHIHISKGFKR